MFRVVLKLFFLFLTLAIVSYSFLVYIDLRSYAILKNLEQINKKGATEKFKDYQWNSKNVFLFIQLTDIHISIFRDPNRVPQLKQFLTNELSLIRPELVLVSGDLTDAKTPDYRASRQYEEEWKIYRQILDELDVDAKTTWLDLRGNHDAFNILSHGHNANYYAKYALRGVNQQRSYMHTLVKPYGRYNFVAMDTVPMPGAKRPYNFFGFLDTATAIDIQRFARKSRGSNHTFWFGHYPLSIIVSYEFDLHKFLGKHAYSYMCGHLHTLGGAVPNMYSLHPDGFFELELGDWMDNRYYRLVSVDNDLVSFSDLRLSNWPIVHVSSPKSSRFLLPHKEPTRLLALSKEIRVFAFSPDGMASVKVWIDSNYVGTAKPHPSVHGLFALPWQPEEFGGAGVRRLEVLGRDKAGRETWARQEFSLDGRPTWQFKLLPSLLLLGDVTGFLRLGFYTAWLALFAPLLVMRAARYRFADAIVKIACCMVHPTLSRGLYTFVLIDRLFYPWIIYFLYMGCGPLMLGYFIDDQFGVMFLNGLYIGGAWLPESFIFVTEFLQICIFHLPLLLCLSYRLGRAPDRRVGWRRLLNSVNATYLLLVWQFGLSVNHALLTYGVSVFLLGPGRLWQVAFGYYLHSIVQRRELGCDHAATQ